jgi:putative FmdB family regulatory protein
MPIYEYRCTSCGLQREFLRKLSDAPLTTCPECGKETLSKMVTAAGFQLKGTGWYATDFKGGAKRPSPAGDAAAAGGTAAPAAAAGSEAKTESKTESAAPASCGGACACH